MNRSEKGTQHSRQLRTKKMFPFGGTVLLLGGVGAWMVYKKYREDSVTQQTMGQPENPLDSATATMDPVSNGLIGSGMRQLPVQANVRPNPLLQERLYTPNPRPIAPRFHERLMLERRLLQNSNGQDATLIRRNSNFLRYAGDPGQSTFRFYRAAAKQQAALTSTRRWARNI